jgi:hypothetical protein
VGDQLFGLVARDHADRNIVQSGLDQPGREGKYGDTKLDERSAQVPDWTLAKAAMEARQ